jgi:Flp pilus assembly protein TadB
MTREFVLHHWGLLAASILLAAVAMNLWLQHVRQSSSVQLRRALGERAEKSKLAQKARSRAEKAETELDRLLQKAEKVRPRHLQDAKGALQDLRALQKIAEDQLLIAENHVRRIIHEEFPPLQHEKLRTRYLPEPGQDRRPFSF